MTKIKAEIVADSLSPQGDRLTSLLITFPRIILAEVNTHRMLSKNTSSSRAIPFNKMVEAIQENPFIPIAWQKEHKGMQGSEYITEKMIQDWAVEKWLEARDCAIQHSKMLNTGGVTKQLCNRLLEPFMWTTMLITGSKEGWDNFFKLRCPQYNFPDVNQENIFKSRKEVIQHFKDTMYFEKYWKEEALEIEWLQINKGQAEIHMMALAEAIYDAINESTPKQLETGQWHIPFEDRLDSIKVEKDFNTMHPIQPASLNWYLKKLEIFKVKISTAMAARTSYTVVGDEKEINYERMIELHDRLISQDPPHSSPMEHCARAMTEEKYDSFIKGEVKLGLDTSSGGWGGPPNTTYHPNKNTQGWCNNFKGFIPYRYLIENDYEQ